VSRLIKPRWLLWLYGAVTVLLVPWTVLLLPVGPLADLGTKVWYVTLVSHVALILAGLSSWQGGRVEVRQDEAE
jgi:hypothetical protein